MCQGHQKSKSGDSESYYATSQLYRSMPRPDRGSAGVRRSHAFRRNKDDDLPERPENQKLKKSPNLGKGFILGGNKSKYSFLIKIVQYSFRTLGKVTDLFSHVPQDFSTKSVYQSLLMHNGIYRKNFTSTKM